MKKIFKFKKGDSLTLDDLDPVISAMLPETNGEYAVASTDVKITIEIEDLTNCVHCQRPTKKENWGFQSSMCNDDGTVTNMVTCKACMSKDIQKEGKPRK